MYQFYAHPNQVRDSYLTLTDQEATHATKVLRHREGDTIIVSDGEGNRYHGEIDSIRKREVRVSIRGKESFNSPAVSIELCMGLIRKRDRLEFAVEKATELGVSMISLFNADHTEPFNVRLDRVESSVLSAMKQSLRVFLPSVSLFKSLDECLNHHPENSLIVQADSKGKAADFILEKSDEFGQLSLVVGPEGGLSDREASLLDTHHAVKCSLGDYRLRAETAAMMMAGIFGNKKADR